MTTYTEAQQLRQQVAFAAAYILLQQRGGVRWNHDIGGYTWNSNGRPVADSRLQSKLDDIVGDYHSNVERLAGRLENGNINIARWQELMRKEILDAHRTQYIIGRGGVNNMTPRDWGRLGSDLRWMHYQRLDQFAVDIADGKLTPAQIEARSKLYMNSSNKQYWRGKTEAKVAAGYIEEQRFLNPAEHCGDCVQYAARGRVPVGTLPEPGEDSQCQANCKCRKVYYKAGE